VLGPYGVQIAYAGENGTYSAEGSYAINVTEATANARLLAKAPELFEALQEMMEWVSNDHAYGEEIRNPDLDVAQAYARAEAVLKKARSAE
jgi:hypothetical protein